MGFNISLKKDKDAKKTDEKKQVNETNETKETSSDKKSKEPMDKQDMLCYAGSVFFLFLAFLPVIMRNLDPNYDVNAKNGDNNTTTPVKEAKIDKLLCSKTFEEEGYSYLVEITNSYKNEYVDTSVITYAVTVDPSYNILFDEIEIPEYKTISEIGQRGVTVSVEGQKYIAKIDYTLNPSLRDNEMLQGHTKGLTDQRNNYQNNGFACTVE